MISTVMHLTGATGVGKSSYIDQFCALNPGAVQNLTPAHAGEVFPLSAVDFSGHVGVVLDELLKWERSSLAAAIAQLETYAEQNGKFLILVTQDPGDLKGNGIQLKSQPLHVHLERHQQTVTLPGSGQQIHLPLMRKDSR